MGQFALRLSSTSQLVSKAKATPGRHPHCFRAEDFAARDVMWLAAGTLAMRLPCTLAPYATTLIRFCFRVTFLLSLRLF
jgi:hypothetical protein